MTYQVNSVAVGLLRHNDALLLVKQTIVNRPPLWMLPGGMVEPGELFTEALVREVREEAGATVEQIGRLAYVMQIDHPERQFQTIAYCFEVDMWSGELQSADPDNEILEVALVPLDEVPERIEAIHWAAVREPLLAYLSGACPAGTTWFYREENGVQVLQERLLP